MATRNAAVTLIGILLVSATILFLFYNDLLFGLSVEELDDYLTVFTAVSLFATIVILLTGRRSK